MEDRMTLGVKSGLIGEEGFWEWWDLKSNLWKMKKGKGFGEEVRM